MTTKEDCPIHPRLQKDNLRFCFVHCKVPLGAGWQDEKNAYKYTDPKLHNRIKKGENHGVIGGYGDIMIVDADSQKIVDAFSVFPDTFTIQTGNGKHQYYYVPGLQKSYALQEETEDSTPENLHFRNIGHITSKGRMVVAPGCKHYKQLNNGEYEPTGKTYKVVKDVPIQVITEEQMLAVIKPFLSETIRAQYEQQDAKTDSTNRIDIPIILVADKMNGMHRIPPGYRGHNPDHHQSKSRMDLAIDTTKNWWVCGACAPNGCGFGNTLYLIALNEGILHCHECKKEGLRGDKFLQVKKLAIEKYGVSPDVFKTQKKDVEKIHLIDEEENEESLEETETLDETSMIDEIAEGNDETFIGSFVRYIQKRTNAPKPYAIHMAIQLLGISVGVNTVHNIQPAPQHHNTYIALIGASTVARKTTVQNHAMALVSQDKMLPSDFSPEGFLKSLETTPQGVAPLGEFSSFLRSIKYGGYMAKFKELQNELHSCPEIYHRRLAKKNDSVTINNVYLNLNTTCTQEEFFSNLDDNLLYGGTLARWILVEGDAVYKPRCKLAKDVIEDEHLLRKVLRNVERLFNPTMPLDGSRVVPWVEFEFTDAALEEFNKIDKLLMMGKKWNDIKPFVGRYLNYLICYADLLVVSDVIGYFGLEGFANILELHDINIDIKRTTSTNSTIYPISTVSTTSPKLNRGDVRTSVETVEVVKLFKKPGKSLRDNNFPQKSEVVKDFHHFTFFVTENYVQRAFKLLKPCLYFARQVTRFVNEDMKIARVKAVMERHAPLSRSICMRKSKLCKKDFDEAVDTLIEREEIFIFLVAPKSKKAREKKVYCLSENKNTDRCKQCRYKACVCTEGG